jgi:hypothetical protein
VVGTKKVESWQDWDIHLRALIAGNCRYKKAEQFPADSFYRFESDENAISKGWISEKTKRSYIYIIKKFVEYPLLNMHPYRFELSKLAFRLSRIIYNNISKSEGVRLFLYSQNRLGYSRIVSSIWLIHIILSHPGVPLIFRKIANVIPKIFLKSKSDFQFPNHLTASSLS